VDGDWDELEQAAFPEEWHARRERLAGFYREHGVLVCAECGVRSRGAAVGWRAGWGRDFLDEDEQPEVLVFCPSCWYREFEDK
jgi:hypothetical protein